MKRGRALRSLPSSRIARRVVFGYWAGVLLFVAWTAVLAMRDHGIVPRADEARLLREMYLMPFVDWLFAFQNGHRLPATRLFFVADFYAFDGQIHLLIASSLALLVLSSVVLWRALGLDGGLDEPLPRLLFGWITLVIFWSASVFNLLCGVCNGNTVVLLFSLIALACLSQHASWRWGGRDSNATLKWALAAATLATAGMGHGIAIWPALLVVGLSARLPLRDVGAIAATSLVIGGLLTMTAPTQPPIATALAHPLELLRFTATLLGSAVARTAISAGLLDGPMAPASRAFGIVGLAGVTAYVVYTWRRREGRSPQDLLAIGISTFAATVAFGIATNRLFAFGPNTALAPRFFDWSALFWIGAAVALAAFARRRPGSFWAGTVGIAVTTAVLLASLPGLRAPELDRIERNADAAVAFLVGAEGPHERRRLYRGDAAELEELTERLRRERKSFFLGPRAEWMGRHLDALFSRAPRSRCRGAVGRNIALFSELVKGPPTRVRGSRGAQLRGWAWDEEQAAPPESIVLVGEGGVVEGLGNVYGRTQSSFFDTSVTPASWKGWGTTYRANVNYSVYGVIDGGRRVCHVAGPEAPQS